MPPDVSVVMAVKNEEKYVREALDSILMQVGVVFEIVVVDDGSDDDTWEILQSYQVDKIRVLSNPKPGKARAFSLGVEQSQGQWVCVFAGDDIMPAGSLAARWHSVKDIQTERPVVGLSRLMQISEVRAQHGIIVPKDPNRGGLTGTSYLMDRRSTSLLFPIPEDLPNEDTWLEAAILHLDLELVHSGVIGNHWRVHPGNSVNMLVPFETYNSKITPRLRAYSLLKERHQGIISNESMKRLNARIACEDARKEGRMLGVMTSGAPLVDRLRALSATNAMMYAVRRQFYGLLSGW